MAKKKNGEEQVSMFALKEGQAKEEEKKEKKPLEYEKFGYDRSDVVSSFIKEMRLGNVEDALYWLRVMRKANEEKNYIVRRLICFAGEDAWGLDALSIASHLVNTFGWEGGDWNLVEQACVQLTLCRKWHELPEGVAWKKAEMKNERLIKLGKFKPIPGYAADEHCKAGWDLKKEGKWPDERMSGNGNGIAMRIDAFEKFGEFKWQKGLRGWDRYVREEFDDATGTWKKEKDQKAENYQPPSPRERSEERASYEGEVKYDIGSKKFLVESETEKGKFYTVDLIEGHCTCPLHEKRGSWCKHMEKARNWVPF